MSIVQGINGTVRKIPTWPLYILGFIPAGVYLYWGITNQLGADPVAALEHQLGLWALQLLVASLLFTPLRNWFNLNLIKFRRPVGLFAFYYTVFHLLTYLLLDKQLDWGPIIKDITKRPYIIVGVLALLAMIPLSITSNNWMIRKLGPVTWRRLHKLAYIIALFGAAHYMLLVKAWPIEPIVYCLIMAFLVGYRFYKLRGRVFA